MLPIHILLHVRFSRLINSITISSGSVISIVIDVSQLFSSVTVSVYEPTHKSKISSEFEENPFEPVHS